MISGPDLAHLIAYATTHGAKIILAGDISQRHARHPRERRRRQQSPQRRCHGRR
jgi:hypothetical protein